MLLPLLGFTLSALLFGGLGLVLLPRAGIRPVRPTVLITFIIAAQVGVLAFGAAYGAVFGSGDNQLHSTAAVIGLLAGMPVVGVATGWLAARAIANRRLP